VICASSRLKRRVQTEVSQPTQYVIAIEDYGLRRR
jgi:hypothetical protein